MVDARQFLVGSFIGLADVEESPIEAEIRQVDVESTKYHENALILTLDTADRLVCNNDRLRILCQLLGSETDKWDGHKIRLYAGTVASRNAVRIQSADKPAAPQRPSVKTVVEVPPEADVEDTCPF